MFGRSHDVRAINLHQDRCGRSQLIIRPACTKNYTVIPNALLKDRRLSIDTRGMIAYLLSLPKNWEIRLIPLSVTLSRKDGPSVGRKKMDRMFSEAMGAGYAARSAEQTHNADGSWGRYDYIVGMPDDVAVAVAKSSGAFLPRRPEAHTRRAHAPKEHSNHKRKNHKSLTDKNPPLTPPTKPDRHESCQDEYSDYGQAALAAGCKFAYEDSEPFNAWIEHRRAEGMFLPPPIDVVVINGERRTGAWFPQLYPPGYRRGGQGASREGR
jgi:hypothetical protein